jgi:hypothetical protein
MCHGGEKKFLNIFVSWENLKDSDQFEELGTDAKIMQ